MQLNEARDKAKSIADAMPEPKWGVYQRFADLVEEVGELANAIQTTEGWKTKGRAKSELVDSVSDVLFEVLCIAALYKIDLDKEFPKVLDHIENRRKAGEFDHV